MLEHVGVPPGFSGGGDSDGWADTESASNRKESIHSINLLIDLLAWTDACARQRLPCHSELRMQGHAIGTGNLSPNFARSLTV